MIGGWIGVVLGEGDPNDIRLDGDKGVGLTKTPMSTEKGHRRGRGRQRVQRVTASKKYALKGRILRRPLTAAVSYSRTSARSALNTSRAVYL